MKMFAMAGLVFAADLAAVLLIVLSLWLEHWFGLSSGMVLDFVFVAAVCYGIAGWIVGKIFMRDLVPNVTLANEQPPVVEHPIQHF